MSDKRSVATDALETLGTCPIPDNSGRDAIHLAVIPVRATGWLQAGDHIDCIDGTYVRCTAGKGVGIVDPFLTGHVNAGEMYWLVLYPRTIQSLRHVWSHPAFPDEAKPAAASAAARRKESEAWIRRYVESADMPIDYDRFMELMRVGVVRFTSHDEEVTYQAEITTDSILVCGEDASGAIPSELWDHVETVLGKKLANRPTYFSCSC